MKSSSPFDDHGTPTVNASAEAGQIPRVVASSHVLSRHGSRSQGDGRSVLAGGSSTPLMGGHLHPVPADLHTAPAASVVLARVVEIEDARGVCTLFNQAGIDMGEEVRRPLRQQRQNAGRMIQDRLGLFLQPALLADETTSYAKRLRQSLVDALDERRRDVAGGSDSLQALPQNAAEGLSRLNGLRRGLPS